MYNGEQQQQQRSTRPEMRGPQNSDIDNILSGLKTRSVNIHEQQPQQSGTNITISQDDDSMISISSLKDIQNGNGPKRSKRKNSSNKNTVSLDI
jgi:multidrug efflux pump subunit AcrB